jgi:hypothetical protein
VLFTFIACHEYTVPMKGLRSGRAENGRVRWGLAVPDSRRMTIEVPAPLSRELPALLRAEISAVRSSGTVEMRVEGVTSEVVHLSIAGPLRPGAALAPPPDSDLGGFEFPAPARRAAAMVRNRGGRVEDRSSAAAGRLRLIVRLFFDPEDAMPVEDSGRRPNAGLAGTTPHRPRGPRRR